MATVFSSTKWKHLLVACALLVVSLVLAACGDDEPETTVERTTTVTTAEAEMAAEGTTTTADGSVITTDEAPTATEEADSDAGTAIPDDQTAVEGAQPEDATATTATTPTTAAAGTTATDQGGVDGVLGEDPNSGVETGMTVTDPTTGETITQTTDPQTGEVVTTTATDPETGEAVTTEEATGEIVTTTTTDPETGEVVTTTTTAEETEAATTATTPVVPETTIGASGAATNLDADPTLPGADNAILERPFSADSPWNTAVSDEPVDSRSETWMRLSEIRVSQLEEDVLTAADEAAAIDREFGNILRSDNDTRNLEEDCVNATARRGDSTCRRIRTGLTINVTRWTVPVFSNTQDGAVERIAICRQFNCGPDAVSSIVIPADACPDPRYDGWMTVIDNTTRTALDFWRARCENDGSLSYHYVKEWSLDGPGFQQPGGVSARGSGLPLFAGLITPEEIRDGRIEHALAISVPGAATRRYVQPASRTDGTGFVNSLPEGARIRLRGNARKRLTRRLERSDFVRNKTQRRTARIIIAALQRYGAIVVDRSAAPTMYAQRNADWNNILPLNLLQDIGLRQFEAVEVDGETFFDPPREGEGAFDATGVGSPPVTGTGAGTQAPDDGGFGLAAP